MPKNTQKSEKKLATWATESLKIANFQNSSHPSCLSRMVLSLAQLSAMTMEMQFSKNEAVSVTIVLLGVHWNWC